MSRIHPPVVITLLFLSCNRNPLDTADELRFMQPPSHSLIHVQCPPHVVAGALMLRHLWMALRAPDQPRTCSERRRCEDELTITVLIVPYLSAYSCRVTAIFLTTWTYDGHLFRGSNPAPDPTVEVVVVGRSPLQMIRSLPRPGKPVASGQQSFLSCTNMW